MVDVPGILACSFMVISGIALLVFRDSFAKFQVSLLHQYAAGGSRFARSLLERQTDEELLRSHRTIAATIAIISLWTGVGTLLLLLLIP